MPTFTGIIRVYHGTLTASTVDKVDMVVGYKSVRIHNRGATEIFVSTDAANDPTVAGAEFDVVPINGSALIAVIHQLTIGSAGATEVRLISSGTPAYSIVGTGAGL